MDISSVNSDLIRGNVTTIILGCLFSEDRYGYDILKEIEDRSNGQYALKQATLYNQLKRLEKQGLVSSYDGAPDDTGGGKRRYYALTPEGKNYLLKEKSEYEYSRTILDKLVSEKEFDFTTQIPFDASELRPYSKREGGEEKPKVVYKDKIVEVQVEKTVYVDRFGNHLSEEEAEEAARQALIEDEQARKNEEELISIREKLREIEEERDSNALQVSETEQQQKDTEAELLAKEERLRAIEEERLAGEERMRLAEEERLEKQLRDAEEEKRANEERLRRYEEEKSAAEEELRAARAERDEAAEKLRKYEEERLAEAERKRALRQQPSANVNELFAKLDAESEYSGAQPQYVESEKTEAVYSTQSDSEPVRQSSLEDIFRILDERNARKSEEQATYEQPQTEAAEAVAESVAADSQYCESELQTCYTPQNGEITSSTINRSEQGFEYEKDNVNYRDFFYSIAEQPKQPSAEEAPKQQSQYSDDVKTRLYAKGFKIRPYDRGNTSEYYTFNFIQSARLNRDTFLIILALYVLEVAVMWVSLASRISYAYFLPVLLVGSALCLIPTVLFLLNPSKRTRANFNFKLSILNRTMLFIELSVVCILIGFFALGASVNDIDLILCSIILPAVLLLDLPISSVVYWLLYRTRKYHIA